MVPNRRNSNFRPCKSTQIQHFLGLSRLNPLMGLLGYSLFFSGNYPCQIMWVLRQCPQLGSRLFHQCSGDNLPQIFRGMSKILKRKCQRSSLKELRSCVLCIISVWSLFCLMRLYSGLHFLPIALEEWLFMFPCLNSDHYYDRLYWLFTL